MTQVSSVSKIAAFLKENSSPRVFDFCKKVYQTVARPNKTKGEMDFWLMQYQRQGNTLDHNHFEPLMQKMSEPLGKNALKGKFVCDFGCGPRGSLTWLVDQSHCVGIDVLVPQYMEMFPDVIRDNRMTYVYCSEDHIPIKSEQVDVLFTMNALDHVSDLPKMCSEILRILKPGGVLIGSFNLGEAKTVTEPQTLDEKILEELLFQHFNSVSKQTAAKFEDNGYAGFFGRETPPDYNGPKVMWYVGKKIAK